jgi:negative regulator of sigma E activity
MRGSKPSLLRKGFESRVNLAIDGEPVPAASPAATARSARWWRPLAGTAVVAGVAAVAIVAMQQRTLVTPGASGTAVTAQSGLNASVPAASAVLASNREAISYTVPQTPADAPAAPPSGRLTNYMFAHSKSSGLGQRGVLADLLIEDDDQPGVVRQPAAQVTVPVAR